MTRCHQTNTTRLRRIQHARDGNLALLHMLHHRQAELRDARRSIPLQDALVDEAYFELRENAAYAVYLETIARDRDLLQDIQTPDVEIAAALTMRTQTPEESTNGESL